MKLDSNLSPIWRTGLRAYSSHVSIDTMLEISNGDIICIAPKGTLARLNGVTGDCNMDKGV